MNDLIIVDTREKGHNKILEYFTKVNQDYIISKLDAGDSIVVNVLMAIFKEMIN